MLKKLQRRLQQRKLAATIGLVLALTAPTAPAWADIGAQNFGDGASHSISDNINTGAGPGLSVTTAATSALMSDLSIKVTATGTGAYANRGTITLTNVLVSAVDGYGVAATSFGTLTMKGGSIFAAGSANNFGAGAALGGKLYLTNVNISTEDDSVYGAYAATASTVEMTGGSITTIGASSHGAYINAAGTITLKNVTINTSGAGSAALLTTGGTLSAEVNGQSITAENLMSVIGGTINLTASSGSRLYGTTSAGGGTANLTLNSGATWWMPGGGASSSLTNLTLNGGTVYIAPTIGGPNRLDILTDLRSDAGYNGGTIYMNADLVSLMGADLIVVGGTARGNHQLFVRTLVRPTDPLWAARLVDLNPLSGNTATFSGGSDVGVYRYGVGKGSDLVAGYSGILGLEDIYLYNTFGPSTPARAAISTYADSVVVWYGEMNEIKKRMGELRMGTQSSDDFWVRAYSERFDVKPSGMSAYSQIMRGLEIGKDNPQAFKGGKKYTGFVAGSGRADNSFSAGGNGATYSIYLGSYASWLRDDGAYFDLIGKYNWFRHSFDTPLMGGGSDSGAYRNQGLGLSAEIGKRFTRKDGSFVEPAVELAALWAGKANYATANGLAVELPDTRSLQLRIGCTVGQKWQGKDGATRQVYGKAAWVNEFAGDSTVRVDAVGFESSLKGHQWVTGMGFVEDTGSRQVYIDVEKSWGSATSKKWGVNTGYRWKF